MCAHTCMHTSGREQREGKRETLKQAPCLAQSPTQGSISQTRRSQSEPKSDTQPIEPPRRPKALGLNEGKSKPRARQLRATGLSALS